MQKRAAATSAANPAKALGVKVLGVRALGVKGMGVSVSMVTAAFNVRQRLTKWVGDVKLGRCASLSVAST